MESNGSQRDLGLRCPSRRERDSDFTRNSAPRLFTEGADRPASLFVLRVRAGKAGRSARLTGRRIAGLGRKHFLPISEARAHAGVRGCIDASPGSGIEAPSHGDRPLLSKPTRRRVAFRLTARLPPRRPLPRRPRPGRGRRAGGRRRTARSHAPCRRRSTRRSWSS